MGPTPKDIYLDNAATTEPWPEVRFAMDEVLGTGFGNPSSLHRRGVEAAKRVRDVAEKVRGLVGGDWKVIFTSGGTEANNTAVFGFAPKGKRKKIVTSAVEHSSVTDACAEQDARGLEVVTVSAGKNGVLDPEALSGYVDDRTALVTVAHVAGEMGTAQPVEEVAALVKRSAPRCRFHVDAVQASAQLARLAYSGDVDSVALSAHKIHGPQGVGALLLRPGVNLHPMLYGGDQQDGTRPGTMNLPGIVGFGVAAEIHRARRAEGVDSMRRLAEDLLESIVDEARGVRLLGAPERRAAGMIVLAVDGVRSEVLLHNLELHGVIASAGSACHARRSDPPACLVDAGLRRGEGTVRFSLTIDTEEDDVRAAAEVFASALDAARGKTSGY